MIEKMTAIPFLDHIHKKRFECIMAEAKLCNMPTYIAMASIKLETAYITMKLQSLSTKFHGRKFNPELS